MAMWRGISSNGKLLEVDAKHASEAEDSLYAECDEGHGVLFIFAPEGFQADEPRGIRADNSVFDGYEMR